MPGARCTRSLACESKKAHEVVTTGSPERPGIPRAMVLTVSFVISPVIGLCCHRRRQVTTCQLDASVEASGPHDFAVRISTVRQKHQPRPSHPVPNVRDDRETPLCVGRDGETYEVIWVRDERKYFSSWGWTAKRLICLTGI